MQAATPAAAQQLSFGPVVEQELKSDTAAIDFDTGRVAGLPDSMQKIPDLGQAIISATVWLEREGMDAVFNGSNPVLAVGMKVAPLKNDAWENMTVEQLLNTLEPVAAQDSQPVNPGPDGPGTYAFQTRKGGRGILQVIALTDAGVKFRYKMVQNASAPAPQSEATPVPSHGEVLTAGGDSVQAAQAGVEDARGKLETASKLYERGQITAAEYETAKGNYAAAEIELVKARLSVPATPVPDEAEALNKSGLEKQAGGDLDGAIADFSRAIALAPKYARAYSNRGLAEATKGNLNAARDDYNIALTIDPNLADAYCNRCAVEKIDGDFQGAHYDVQFADEIAFAAAEKFMAAQPFAGQYAAHPHSARGQRYEQVEFVLLSDATGRTLGVVGFNSDTGECIWLGNKPPESVYTGVKPADLGASAAWDQAAMFLSVQPFGGKYAKHGDSGSGDTSKKYVDVNFTLLPDTAKRTWGTVRVDVASGKCFWLGDKP
jgi:tetratricopeptide (TPR) repeat protein